MMKKNWMLIDAQDAIHKDIDDSANDATHELEKGSKVKLIFSNGVANEDHKNIEHLWVEILLVQDDKYLGQLQDDPKKIINLSKGELIEFETKHIYESEYIDPFGPRIKV